MPAALGAVSHNETKTAYYGPRSWLVAFSAALYFFYEFMQVNMFNAIDPALMSEFHVSAEALGQLSANYFYANVIFLFPAGIILDRVSTRLIILLAMFVSVLSTVVFASTSSFFVMHLCRFATGIAGSFCFLSCLRLAPRWFPPRRLALVIGLTVTMAMLGGMLAQTPMTLLTDSYGWRKTLMIDACLGAVLLAFIFCFVKDFPPGFDASQQRQRLQTLGFWRSLGLTLTNIQNWLAGLYTSLLNLPIFLLGAMWGSLFLVQVHDLTRAQASYVTSMIFIGTIIGSPAIGMLSDRIARRKMPMIVCGFISLALMLWLMYAPHLNLMNSMLLFFLLGFFTSAQVISYPLIAESNPHILTGSASGLASVLIMAGGISQPFFGWLMGLHWNHRVIGELPVYSLNDYRTALAIMPIAFVIGLLASFCVKETYCKAQD